MHTGLWILASITLAAAWQVFLYAAAEPPDAAGAPGQELPPGIFEKQAQDMEVVSEVPVNFTKLMRELKMEGGFDENSVKVTEVDKTGGAIKPVPCNFIKHPEYDPKKFAGGRVVFRVAKAERKAGEKEKPPYFRYYKIGFGAEGQGGEKQAYDTNLLEGNLVALGGFEETNKAAYLQDNWQLPKGCEISAAAARDGKYSLEMRVLPDDKSGVNGIRTPLCQVRSNEQYTLAFWVKGKNAYPGPHYSLISSCYFWNETNAYVSHLNFGDTRDANFDWRRIEKVVEVPGGVSQLQLCASTRAREGAVYIDDVSITPLLKAQLTVNDDKKRTEQMYPCLDYYFDISSKYATPHFNWAKPSAAGKLKILYCNYMQYVTATTKRRVIEFAARMDLAYTYLPLLKRMTNPSRGNLGMNSGDTYADDLEQYCLDRLAAEAAGDYRVIVVQGLDFKGVQKEAVDLIKDEAGKGKGLVLLDCKNIPEVFEKIMAAGKVNTPANFAAIPQICFATNLLKQGTCRLAGFGNGRMAIMEMPKPTSQYPNYYGREIPYWEYLYLPAMKAFMWAAGDNKAATVAKIEFREGALQAEVSAAAAQEAVFEITYRDEYNQVDLVDKKGIALTSGTHPFKLDLPQMRGGFHLADYRLLDASGKTLDFGSCDFSTPLAAGIGEIRFDKECYRAGEEIEARIVLTNIAAGCMLICEVEDTFNRRLLDIPVTLKEGQAEAQARFKLVEPLSILHRLFARVEKDGRVLVRKMGEFSTPFGYPPDDELLAYTWYGQPPGLKAWGDNGFDDVIVSFPSGGASGILKALCNMNLRPYGYGAGYLLGDPGNKYHGERTDDLVREPCFSDPDYWKKLKAKCQELMKKDRHVYYGVRDYQLTDEISLGAEVCFSPHCLADFRKYLKEKYPGLEALNAEWRSDFKTWQEVKPITLAEVKEEKGNLPQWLDHRLFMNLVFARWIAKNKEIVRELSPHATMGLSGTQNPGNTFDWWEDMKSMDFLANYGGIQCDLINSFRLRGARTGQWTGGYAPTEKDYGRYEKYYPWLGVLNGNTAYMFFHGSADGTTLLGDLRFTTNGQYAVEEVQELKSGPARMLFSSERVVDGIGMLYSQSSLFAALATIGKEYWDGGMNSWKYLVNDLGLNFRFLSYEQLENEKLDNERYKVFILPVALSLSAGQIGKLRDFVRKGGVLIADYAPGIYDEHGRKCDNEGLMELFGVRRGPNSKINIQECQVEVKADAARGIKGRSLPVKCVEEGLELTTAKALGAANLMDMNFNVVNVPKVGPDCQSGRSDGRAAGCGDPALPSETDKVARRKAAGPNSIASSTGGPAPTAGGQAMPAVVINQFGNGRAILLNCVFSDYVKVTLGGETSEIGRGNPKVTAPFKDLMAEIFENSGVKRGVWIRTKKNEDFQPFILTTRYANGPLRYVGILKEPAHINAAVKPADFVPVTISFEEGGHVYDVRSGKYLGETLEVETEIAPAVAKLYAILPYRVMAVELQAGKPCPAGSALKIPVRIITPRTSPGNHVLHVEVFGPDKKIRSYYTANIILTKGKGVISLGTALNDEKGKWEIVVRDTATGVKARAEFEIQ